MPYNIFSTHFLEENQDVIHTYDPGAKFLNNNCSLYQGHFGLERTITLGQFCHAFHVTCIANHSLWQSVCPECQSLRSTRFYKMVGL
jgi:hypothetical protein